MKSKCDMASFKQWVFDGLAEREKISGTKENEIVPDHVLVKIHSIISFYGSGSRRSIRRVN